MTPAPTLVDGDLRCPVCGAATVRDDRFVPAPIARCTDCGLGVLSPDVAAAEYDDDYFENYVGGDYLAHEPQRRHESRLRLDSLAAIAGPGSRLLEIGSAAGFLLDEARGRGLIVRGVEPNEEMARYAREVLGLDVRAGTIQDAELTPAAVDLACAFHVLEHIGEPVDALRRIAEAVRPGGHVAVEVPNADSCAAHRQGARWQPLDLPYHVGHHSPLSLATALRRAGLEVVQIDTVPFAHYARGPRAVVSARGIAEALRGGDAPAVRPHPNDHQLLRGLARRPATA